MQKVLILGGTQFIGRALVEALEKNNNYELTLFNRQQTNPALFPQVKKIKGDRETKDIDLLKNQDWDFVIDLSCYYPANFAVLLQVLKGRIKRYILLSTIAVYALPGSSFENGIAEDFPTLYTATELQQNKSADTYGRQKAACEQILLHTEGIDKIILRPSIVYGANDPTDRLYYWLYRSKQKQPFILPDHGEEKITLTYVHDLTKIIMASLAVQSHSIIYNATTHPPFLLKDMLMFLNSHASAVAVNPDDLLRVGILPEKDIPLWFNSPLLIPNEKLKQDFPIECSTFAQSLLETMNYYESLHWPVPKVGLSMAREKEFLNYC